MTSALPLGTCQCGCGGRTGVIKENHPSRGQVVGQFSLCLPGHHVRKTLRDVFYKYVIKGEGCWDWSGPCTAEGYGRLNFYGDKIAAHRASYEIHHDKIPTGMLVCHACDNPRCIRPDHLFLGDISTNTRDAARKGRLARGENHSLAKLTEQQARDIILESIGGLRSYGELARKHNVSKYTVANIVNGRSWKHLHESPILSGRTPFGKSAAVKMLEAARRIHTFPIKLFRRDWELLERMAESVGTTPAKFARAVVVKYVRRKRSMPMLQSVTPESPGFGDKT